MSDSTISKATSSQDLTTARSSEAVGVLHRAEATGSSREEIDKAARSFESLLVGHWLEQAEKSFASVPGTDPDQQNDSSRDQFMSIACESLAQGLSNNGGLGIAKMISRGLQVVSEHQGGPSKPTSNAEPQPASNPL